MNAWVCRIGLAVALVCLWPGVAQAALVGDWEMTDKGSPPPQMTDSSGNNNDGSVSGGVEGTGSIFRFDGSGVAVVPNTSNLSPGTRNATITASIAFTRKPGHDYDIVRKKPAGVAGMQYRMEITSTGKAKCFFTGDIRGGSVTAGGDLSNGSFHTIACTKTSSTIGITVDGHDATRSITVGQITNSEALSVGAKAGGGDNFVGSINYVRINYG